MNWKHLLESASESVNDDLRLRNAYLVAENRMLRNQIDGRVQLTACERRELAAIGAKLGKKALQEIATIAQPATILGWNRKAANEPVASSKPSKSVGRPRVDQEIEDLVIRMARENHSWGYDRIQGALKPLGYTISDQTVGNILKRHRIPPAPERKKTRTWREFIRCHLDVLMATDFFNSERWSGVRFLISCLFGVIDAGRNHVQAVRMFRHQRMLEMHSFVIHVLNGQAQRTRGNSWIRRVTRSWAMRFGEAHPFNPLSEIPPHKERHHHLQPKGHVVLLSAVGSGHIRAGPIRHRFGGLLEGDYREAA